MRLSENTGTNYRQPAGLHRQLALGGSRAREAPPVDHATGGGQGSANAARRLAAESGLREATPGGGGQPPPISL